MVIVEVTDSRHPDLRVSLMLSLVLGAASLVACIPANEPKIVFGDAKTVSFVSGWFAPEA